MEFAADREALAAQIAELQVQLERQKQELETQLSEVWQRRLAEKQKLHEEEVSALTQEWNMERKV